MYVLYIHTYIYIHRVLLTYIAIGELLHGNATTNIYIITTYMYVTRQQNSRNSPEHSSSTYIVIIIITIGVEVVCSISNNGIMSSSKKKKKPTSQIKFILSKQTKQPPNKPASHQKHGGVQLPASPGTGGLANVHADGDQRMFAGAGGCRRRAGASRLCRASCLRGSRGSGSGRGLMSEVSHN
jgi:hypothetical protein